MTADFPPTRAAALARLAGFDPDQYARSRNAALTQALGQARTVQAWSDPHIAALLPDQVQQLPAPALFRPVKEECGSFSQWWARSKRGVQSLDDLPGFNGDR